MPVALLLQKFAPRAQLGDAQRVELGEGGYRLEARVLLLEAGPLALGMDAPHPEAHAAAEEEARHVVADEGDEVERRGERALGVLELEDHLGALKLPVEARVLLDALVGGGHRGDEEVDEHEGGDEKVAPHEGGEDLLRGLLVSEQVLVARHLLDVGRCADERPERDEDGVGERGRVDGLVVGHHALEGEAEAEAHDDDEPREGTHVVEEHLAQDDYLHAHLLRELDHKLHRADRDHDHGERVEVARPDCVGGAVGGEVGVVVAALEAEEDDRADRRAEGEVDLVPVGREVGGQAVVVERVNLLDLAEGARGRPHPEDDLEVVDLLRKLAAVL
mmetsp:Transcript_28132/g.69432  ORF Transcript_28132/g.69432 Transcript_28132/m.69432 type:complete len:333 (+) Transcript_28132:338-1336(+)